MVTLISGQTGSSLLDLEPQSVSIIVPAFNEAETIVAVLEGLSEHCPSQDVIVVDDGSSDDTAKLATAVPGVRVISHATNRGYGASWRTGILNATCPYVAFFDGDGQFDPQDLRRMIGIARESGADMINGMRPTMVGSPLARRPGKWVLTQMAQFLVNQKVPDLNCGLRVMKKDVIRRYLHLLPLGFSASMTSTLVLLKRGYTVHFEAIQIRPRTGKSSVRLVRDGFGTMLLMVRIATLLDPLRVFLPVSLLMFAVSMIYNVMIAVSVGQGVPVLGGVATIASLLIFFLGILSDQIAAIRLEKYET